MPSQASVAERYTQRPQNPWPLSMWVRLPPLAPYPLRWSRTRGFYPCRKSSILLGGAIERYIMLHRIEFKLDDDELIKAMYNWNGYFPYIDVPNYFRSLEGTHLFRFEESRRPEVWHVVKWYDTPQSTKPHLRILCEADYPHVGYGNFRLAVQPNRLGWQRICGNCKRTVYWRKHVNS